MMWIGYVPVSSLVRGGATVLKVGGTNSANFLTPAHFLASVETEYCLDIAKSA